MRTSFVLHSNSFASTCDELVNILKCDLFTIIITQIKTWNKIMREIPEMWWKHDQINDRFFLHEMQKKWINK